MLSFGKCFPEYLVVVRIFPYGKIKEYSLLLFDFFSFIFLEVHLRRRICDVLVFVSSP